MLLYLRKKYLTEYDHGYVYITENRYVMQNVSQVSHELRRRESKKSEARRAHQ